MVALLVNIGREKNKKGKEKAKQISGDKDREIAFHV